MVISDRPLTDYVPLQQEGEDPGSSPRFTMNHVEALGLLKMDFLGLRNLDILKAAVRLIRDSKEERDRSLEAASGRRKDLGLLCTRARATASSSWRSGMKDSNPRCRADLFEDICL